MADSIYASDFAWRTSSYGRIKNIYNISTASASLLYLSLWTSSTQSTFPIFSQLFNDAPWRPRVLQVHCLRSTYTILAPVLGVASALKRKRECKIIGILLSLITLDQLCPTRAQSKVLCGPVSVFAVVKVSHILTTCPFFDNLEFDIFDAGDAQCHFITSVTNAVRIRTLLLTWKKKRKTSLDLG